MTLLDIKNHLFSHFLSESTFSLQDDVATLKLPKQDVTEILTTHKAALVKLALEDMTKQGICAEAAPGLYILTQPLNSYSQSVTLNPMVIEMVTDLVNGFGEALEDPNSESEPYVANKLAISADDIARLCHICHVLLDENGDGQDTPAS